MSGYDPEYHDQLVSWHNLESARNQWVDAPGDDDVLDELLDVARAQVMAYANSDNIAWVPQRYRRAQLMHAKNMHAAEVSDSSGGFGDGEFQVRPHPLDWHIKQLIRPRRAVPRVR